MKQPFGKTMHPIVRKFSAEAGLIIALRALAAFMSYLTLVLVARWLPLNDYGIYGTIMSVIGISAVIVQCGATQTTIRYLGEYEVTKKPNLASGIIRYSHRGVALLSLGTTIVFCILALGLEQVGITPNALIWIAGLLLLPAFSVVDLQGAVLRSFNKILPALLPKDILWRAAVIIIGFLLYLFVPEHERLAYLLLGSAGALTLLAVAQHSYQKRTLPDPVQSSKAKFDLKAWWTTTMPIWFLLIARMSFRTIDVIIVGLLVDPAAAGIYFAASRTSELLGFVLSSLNLIVGPNISRLYAARKSEELKKYLALSSVAVFTPALFLFLIYCIMPETILSLFGSEFVKGKWVLILMAFGQLCNAATGSVGVLLNMSGHEKINAKVMVTVAPITALLLFAFTALWGIDGAAFASVGGMIMWNALLWQAARKHTEYDPSLWGAITVLKHTSR
ncbi:MAG: oligosaccharide flippase family protein [Aliivibrio sp.]|uniref:lipopolysaccharide biosynthesis protein n=1 Tax=Aliivibrio sp. TaxID=1872443 RepID=UPI001A4F1B90|nr:oligosaccharide flippase family protein [Aliivibrio sp.]